MPANPTLAEAPARPNPADDAASAVGAESTPDPLDVLQLFRKPGGGDDLAIFGLTATRVVPRRKPSRVL